MRAVFAAIWIALGVWTVATGKLAPVWGPAWSAVTYPSALISIGCGAAWFWKREWSARVLLAVLIAWLVAFRLAEVVKAPGNFEAWFNSAELLGVMAGVCALEFGEVARWLTVAALACFGLGHFVYWDPTVALVPAWLPAHGVLAAATAVMFWLCAAGVAKGLRLAAWIAAGQMAVFAALVWVPTVARGAGAFAWSELGLTIALAVATAVVAATGTWPGSPPRPATA